MKKTCTVNYLFKTANSSGLKEEKNARNPHRGLKEVIDVKRNTKEEVKCRRYNWKVKEIVIIHWYKNWGVSGSGPNKSMWD